MGCLFCIVSMRNVFFILGKLMSKYFCQIINKRLDNISFSQKLIISLHEKYSRYEEFILFVNVTTYSF